MLLEIYESSIAKNPRMGGQPSTPIGTGTSGSRCRITRVCANSSPFGTKCTRHDSKGIDIRRTRASIIPPTKRKRKESLPSGISDMCRATWSFDQTNDNVNVKLSTPLEVLFFPTWSTGAAGILGSRPLERHLIHYWEVTFVDRVFGTSMQVGLTTKETPLHNDRFQNLLGNHKHSWAFNHTGKLRHNNQNIDFCNPLNENETVTIGLMFNGPLGTLSLWKNGQPLGVAFKGLGEVEEDLYPAFASTAARTMMRLTTRWRSFENLQDRCRIALRKKYTSVDALSQMKIPVNLRPYIMKCYESEIDNKASKRDDTAKQDLWLRKRH